MYMPRNANGAAPCPRVPVRLAAMSTAWARRCIAHLDRMYILIAPLPTLLLLAAFGLASLSVAHAQNEQDFLAGRTKACPNCSLPAAPLKRADLTGAKLQRSRLIRATFDGAKLKGALLTAARLDEASLRGADLSTANLVEAT